MKKSLPFILIAIVLSICVLAADDEALYYKAINFPSSFEGPVIVPFDSKVLNSMKSDGSDIRITQDSAQIPVKVIITPIEELAHKSAVTQASSTRAQFRGVSYDPSNLINGDYSSNDNAYFQIDAVKDPNYAWIVFSLPQKTLTDSIKVWSSDTDFTWTDIQVEGSNDNEKWDMVKSKTAYSASSERTITYPPVEYKYLKFSFWHTQSLVLNEIEIYGAYTAHAVFLASKGKSYLLHYANPFSTQPSYDTSALYTSSSTPKATLGPQVYNKAYLQDADSDGSTNDNCPSLPNPDQADSDSDGIGDACDNCPSMPNSNQGDADNDGKGDSCDNCISYPNPDQYDDDFNNKGYACDDMDGDGVINSYDNCVSASNSNQADKDRNGVGDACEDADKDGISFSKDNCLSKPNPDQADSDQDHIGDSCDNCRLGANSNQFDRDSDGTGDACEDADSDSIEDYRDNCLSTSNQPQSDQDADGVGDSCDNCVSVRNPEQTDMDRNSKGDICDDNDNDGIINPNDNCPSLSNPKQEDQNNNGAGDACEDFDNDGVLNAEDNCLYESNPKQYIGNEYLQGDRDRDGKGDSCDGKDSRWTENKPVIWGLLIATILIVGFLAIRLLKKPM